MNRIMNRTVLAFLGGLLALGLLTVKVMFHESAQEPAKEPIHEPASEPVQEPVDKSVQMPASGSWNVQVRDIGEKGRKDFGWWQRAG